MNRAEHIERLSKDHLNLDGRPVLTYQVGEGWMLVQDWPAREPAGLIIPAGFRFDLASVPRLFWPLIAPFDLSLEAPLVHDFLYRFHQPAGFARPFRRGQVDRLLRVIAKREGVCCWRRSLAWLAVRVAGFWAWRVSPRLA